MMPEAEAKDLTNEINTNLPNMAQARTAYPYSTSHDVQGPNGEREFSAVWPNGFAQDLDNYKASKVGYPGVPLCYELIQNEYNAYVQGHQDASQWGLAEGFEWVYV